MPVAVAVVAKALPFSTNMFPAALDTTSKFITYSLMAFALLFPALLSWAANESVFLVLLPNLILPIIILFTWLYSPYAYSVMDGHVLIHRRIGLFRIPLHEVVAVDGLDKKAMGWAIRTMGNGGLFGYTGWHTSSPQGRMRWFVRQQKNYVMLVCANNKKVVLSPNEPLALVQAIREQLPQT